jgi:nucleoside-diphosphate-sugar epimerase
VQVLVTGSTGYLGRAVVKALRRSGHAVVAFSRSASTSGIDAATIDGDIRDGAAVAGAARGCDAIIHTAALVAVWRKRSREFDDINIGGLANVLAAASQHAIPRIVYTSSFLALPPGTSGAIPAWNDYQRTKALASLTADRAVAQGAPIICLHPGVIYGPGPRTAGNLVGNMIADHLAGTLPGVVGSSRIWSFAYIEDVAAAHVAAVEQRHASGRYCLGGENAPQMREMTGQRLPRRLPGWVAAGVALADELRATWLGGIPQLTTGTLEILLHDWPLDSARATRDLGYRVTPLNEGIANILSSLPPNRRSGKETAS